MKLPDLIKLIQERNYTFEVNYNGQFSFDKISVEKAIEISGSLENYLLEQAEKSKSDNISVTLYKKNGNAWIRDGFYSFDIKEPSKSETIEDNSIHTNPFNVAEVKTDVLPIASKVPSKAATIPALSNDQLAALGSILQGLPARENTAAATKTEVENSKLTTELFFVNQRCEELKTRNDKLERMNDEYFSKNLALLTSSTTEKERLELDYQRKKLEDEREQKGGLQGIGDSLGTLFNSITPEHITAIGGLLGKGNSNPASIELNNYSKHADPEVQLLLEAINSTLVNQPKEVIGMFMALVQVLAENHSLLNAIFTKHAKQNYEPAN